MLRSYALLLGLVCFTAGDLQLRVYSNTALAGAFNASIVGTVDAAWPGQTLFSAEWLGCLVPDVSANYSFQFSPAAGWGYFW